MTSPSDDRRAYDRVIGEAILARPDARWEKRWNWARRHPAVAMFIGMSGLASCLALAGVVRYVIKVNRLNEGLEQEIRATRNQSLRASENLRSAVAVIERLIRLGRSELANVPHLEQV